MEGGRARPGLQVLYLFRVKSPLSCGSALACQGLECIDYCRGMQAWDLNWQLGVSPGPDTGRASTLPLSHTPSLLFSLEFKAGCHSAAKAGAG